MLVFLFYTTIFKCRAFHGEENAKLASSSNKKKFTALSWTGKTKLCFFFLYTESQNRTDYVLLLVCTQTPSTHKAGGTVGDYG